MFGPKVDKIFPGSPLVPACGPLGALGVDHRPIPLAHNYWLEALGGTCLHLTENGQIVLRSTSKEICK